MLTETNFMKEFDIYPLPAQILIEVDQYDEFSNGLLIALHNRTWNAVKLFEWRNIAQVSVVKKFVTPNAFQYFVPSLLLGSIREPESWLPAIITMVSCGCCS